MSGRISSSGNFAEEHAAWLRKKGGGKGHLRSSRTQKVFDYLNLNCNSFLQSRPIPGRALKEKKKREDKCRPSTLRAAADGWRGWARRERGEGGIVAVKAEYLCLILTDKFAA